MLSVLKAIKNRYFSRRDSDEKEFYTNLHTILMTSNTSMSAANAESVLSFFDSLELDMLENYCDCED